MKIAQEIRAGNVIMHGKDPMIVLRTEYARGIDSCTLASVSFAAADLTGARFAGAQQVDPAKLDLRDAKWKDAHFEGESESLKAAFEAAANLVV